MAAGRAPWTIVVCLAVAWTVGCDAAPPPPPRPRDAGPEIDARAPDATMSESDGGDGEADAAMEEPDAGRPDCADPGPEPNETEDDATTVTPDPPHCDDTATLSGVLAGSSDVDVFRVQGVDVCGDGLSTTLDERSLPAGVRACVFPKCAITDAPSVICQQGTRATSPNGLVGCCRTGATVALDVVCQPGHSELVYFYVRFDQRDAPADMCSTYRAVLKRL